MEAGKILTSLTVCLSLWMGVVVAVLLYNGSLHDRAIATPISSETNLEEIKQSPVSHSMISGEIKKGDSFDLAMKRLDISDAVRLDIINGFSQKLDFKMLQPGDRFSILFDENNVVTHATYESGLLKSRNLFMPMLIFLPLRLTLTRKPEMETGLNSWSKNTTRMMFS
jgi:hypothetical protein